MVVVFSHQLTVDRRRFATSTLFGLYPRQTSGAKRRQLGFAGGPGDELDRRCPMGTLRFRDVNLKVHIWDSRALTATSVPCAHRVPTTIGPKPTRRLCLCGLRARDQLHASAVVTGVGVMWTLCGPYVDLKLSTI